MEKNNGQSLSEKDTELQRQLEQLKREYSLLNEQRIATERDKKNLEEQLQSLREKALREYGTSDVDELRNLLEKRRLENERMVNEYREHIGGIKEELEAIEKAETEKE
ncbi:MAG: hypothetical protein ABFD97_01570 [Syntrophobacter sp.]